MTNKSNEATPLRPGGDRFLNAPLMQMDLRKFINQLKSESTWSTSDRNSETIFKSESVTIVLMGLHADTLLKKHTAKGNILVQVMEGRIEFRTDEQSVVLENGQMIALQGNIPHSVMAITESFFLLTVFAAADERNTIV